ncbi:MAG: hypothetical protein COA44_10560 [Arcobacter sp.]|nr:MAG: hypothetical protein COA44_10560 [Arcobacter sp.]
MSTPRLVKAPISLVYDVANAELHEREYHTLSEADDDAIGQWLKLAKAKGETSESDPVALKLLIELHRKIDNLERLIKNEKSPRIGLSSSAKIKSIGFGYFQLENEDLDKDERYYGRITMPTYPQREIGVFFKAVSTDLAKLEKIHDRDEKEWGAYVTARERVMIRELKGNE